MTKNNAPQSIIGENGEKYTFGGEVDEKFREELNGDYESALKGWTISEQLEEILKNKQKK